jgi:hypothetical protein
MSEYGLCGVQMLPVLGVGGFILLRFWRGTPARWRG